MSTGKDIRQDEMIRQNAEHIRRNQEAIQKQTKCLEQIRDHYFPKKSLWKRIAGFCLKVIGAITIYTGMMEATEWYLNSRELEGLAEQSVAVARRLMFEEDDAAGAVAFLQRAVELDGSNAKYRAMLALVKGMATVADLFDIGRPLAADEREHVDAILSEAVFLQSSAPKNPMPYILAAQAYVLRQEFARAIESVEKAVALDPKNVQVHCSACAMRFFSNDIAGARAELAEAVRLDPGFPLVRYWQGMLAAVGDKDFAKAREHFEAMSAVRPRLALPHVMIGWALLNGAKPDLRAARVELEKALKINPHLKRALLMMAETYECEGNLTVARLWLDRALECDSRCRYMKAYLARARINEALGEWRLVGADLTCAIALDPFRVDLYRRRANAFEKNDLMEFAVADRKAADALDKAAGKKP